jgi:cell filamentation protein
MKKEKSRYDTEGLIEAQFEPGSRGRVLRNLLGIKSKREMDQVEAQEHLRALDELVDLYGPDHRFTADDICKMHRLWLGNVYAWAGSYRRVNISKGGFMFAAADQIPRLMAELERGPLQEFSPCRSGDESEVAHALAVVHVELVLIHPFREGNGRLARLLSILMALQAGLPPLDFGNIKGKKKKEYFAAVQTGLDRNYEPMERIFSGVIRRTIGTRGRA